MPTGRTGASRTRRQNRALTVLLVSFALVTAACSTAKNNAGSPSVTSSAPSSSAPSSSAPSSSAPSSSAPPSSAAPSSSPPSSSGLVGFYLADFNPVQGYGINVDTTPQHVNGVAYNHPVSWSASFNAGDPYWAEWDLSRKCTWLTSPGVGVSDEAPSGSADTFYVQADGAYKWQKTISLGSSDALKVSIKGALRLRLSVAGQQNGGGTGVWGDARIWCTSAPLNMKS